jgi:hypothetical protein
MSTPCAPRPAKLFVSVLSTTSERISGALSALVDHYGPLDFVSAVLPFNYTDYYHAEMGAPLVRRFASFQYLIQQQDLAPIKDETNLLETGSSIEGKRTVNIDPGYLLAERLVLASGKNQTHRIYLSRGIYADLSLLYRDSDYRPLPWTYPDYAEPEFRGWLRVLRQKYLLQLRGEESMAGSAGNAARAP